MNKLVITTGYMGSGSSAVTDLVSEMENFHAPHDSFEYVFLHCPNGVFDLEDKLLLGNNANRSDEAIHTFYNTMKQLYQLKTRYYWVAGYKEMVSADFLKYVDTFLDEIGVIDSIGTWYYQQEPNRLRLCRIFINKVIKKCTLGTVVPDDPLKYRCMKLAFPTPGEFYHAADHFIMSVLNDLGYSKHNIIMDQLLQPHNLYRISNYFKDDTVVFVVERDPRDVFLLNKYFWKKNPVPYPMDVMEFCKIYRKIRENERACGDKRVVRIHFEDLVYKYDEACNILYGHLGIAGGRHIKKRSEFIPEKSIYNTQLFKLNIQYQKEADYIEQYLKEFCYDFPYELNEKNRIVF